MAREAGTVSILNKAAGKSGSSKRKRTVDVEEISFSPLKKARSTGRLKRKSIGEPTPSRARRNSLSLPEDNAAADAPEPLQKRVRKLKAKESGANPSPLKKLGYSPKEQPMPQRVNLNESPAKNTRSRKAPVFPPKDVEPPSDLAVTPVKRSTRLSVRNGEIEPPPETWDRDREGLATLRHGSVDEESQDDQQIALPEQGEKETRASVSASLADTEQAKRSEASKKSTRRKKSSTKAASQAVSNTNGPSGNARTESGVSNGDEQSHEDAQPAQGKQRTTKYQSKEGEEERRLALASEMFIKGIESVASWFCCYDDWVSAGGVARLTRTDFQHLQPETEQCKGIRKSLRALIKACNEFQEQNMPWEAAKLSIADAIADVVQTCSVLESVKGRSEKANVLRDLYRHAISDTLLAIRHFLKLFNAAQEPLSGWELEQFFILISLAQDLCQQAATLQPRPSELDNEGRIRSGVRPQVKRIFLKYKTLLTAAEQKARIEQEMEELATAQSLQLKAYQRQRRVMHSKIKSFTRKPQQVSKMIEDDIFDIDDFDDIQTNARQVVPSREATGTTPLLPRLERQATEDIIPAPMDWSEDEKAIFLNALEIYQDEDRFWKISQHCDGLQTRSIEDLKTAASYFRELVLTAPEFAGLADSEFSYLLSVV